MKLTKGKYTTLGVAGGLGPLATAWFYELITRMTEANHDQEHLDIIIRSCPKIADRTSYITGQSDISPLPDLLEVAAQLTAQGAGLLAIPCVTAHYFFKEMQTAVQVPIISMLDATADYLNGHGVRKIGVMATTGTISSQLFERSFEKAGIETFVPDTASQADIMHIIYENVKADRPVDMNRFKNAAAGLRRQGAEVIILGCTELSLIKRAHKLEPGYLDTLEILARSCVLSCGAPLRNRAQELIT